MLKTILLIEWERMMKSRRFLYAILLGCSITFMQIVIEEIPDLPFLPGHAITEYPDSVFNRGLMLGFSKFTIIYYTAVMLLAVIPDAVSFYEDRQTGYIRQIMTRIDIRKYLVAKYVVVFVSGGLVAIIPLLINLMVCMAFWPSVMPQPGTMSFLIFGTSMFGNIFYTHPYLYLSIYFLIDFIIAGVFATFALGISWYAFHKYIVMFFPFIVYYLIHFICRYIGKEEFSPLIMMMPEQPDTNINFIYICAVVMLLLFSSLIIYYIGGRKNEIY